MIYLVQPYLAAAKHRRTALIYHNISDALYSNNLRTLATFFREGPGQDIAVLRNIRSLSISYLDDNAAIDWRRRTTSYAYEAFELVYASWHLMQVS